MVSKSPSKQRKAAANAPCTFSASDCEHAALIQVMQTFAMSPSVLVTQLKFDRGDFGHPNSAKGEKGKRSGDARGKAGLRAAVSVDSSSGHIYIEGLTHSKADGKEEGIPVHSSNVVVVKIDDSDPIRLKKLQSMNGGDDE